MRCRSARPSFDTESLCCNRKMAMVGLRMTSGQTYSLSGRSIDSHRFSNVEIMEGCMEASRAGRDVEIENPHLLHSVLLSVHYQSFRTLVQVFRPRCATFRPSLPLPCCWFQQWQAVCRPLTPPKSSVLLNATRNLDCAMSSLWTEL